MGEPNPAYLEVIDFLATRIAPETLLAFRPSEAVQKRVEDLTARSGEGLLSPEEKQELDDYLQLEHLMIMAKAQACRKLDLGKWNSRAS